ncbi:unnamed protein product [Sphacelaria rigidula]
MMLMPSEMSPAHEDAPRAGGQSYPSGTDDAVDDPSVELDTFLQKNESGGSECSPHCGVDGKPLHKQRVLAELIGSQFGNASRDRLKCVRGLAVGPSVVPGLPGVGGDDIQRAGIGNTDARGLGVGDPLVMMVAMPPG